MGQYELQRQLNSRQITFMALGAAIGVGLFLGSGKAIKLAGPSILFAYLIVSAMIFIVMRALGEMAIDQPVSGSFSTYANEYINPFAGYLTGWNYWIMMVIAGVAEITAIGIYMKLWYPDIPQWIWALASVVMIGAINLATVKVYGELGFWFTLIKVITILLIIGGGLSMIFLGWGNNGTPVYISNLWQHGGIFPNGLSGMLLSLPIVICAFCGVESVGIAAGEARDPKHTIPKAIKSVLWRVLFFYVGVLFVMLSIHPWNQIGTEGSPFVSIFEKLGISKAAGFINFVVITAALSTFNSVTFSSGRMLRTLALQKHAPKFFSAINANGVPLRAIVTSLICLMIGVGLNYLVPEKLFGWLVSLLSFNAIWTWTMVLLAHYRFRKRHLHHQTTASFPMPAWPFLSWLGLAFLILIIAVMASSPETRLSLSIGLFSLLLLSGAYKLWVGNDAISEVEHD